MKYQAGKMSAGALTAITIVAIFVLLGIVGVGSYISNANYGNRAEVEIKATWENNENILSQYYQKVDEVAQVPAMYKDDLKEVVTSALSARYGNNGSKATFQWLKEHNISLDVSMYTKIQQVIEAGRDKFQNAQTQLIDQKRAYETNLGYIWKGMWLHMAGYPKIDLAKYKAISTADAKNVFETGIEKGPRKLR